MNLGGAMQRASDVLIPKLLSLFTSPHDGIRAMVSARGAKAVAASICMLLLGGTSRGCAAVEDAVSFRDFVCTGLHHHPVGRSSSFREADKPPNLSGVRLAQAVSNVNLLAGAIVAGMPSALTGALAQYMEGEPLRCQAVTSASWMLLWQTPAMKELSCIANPGMME